MSESVSALHSPTLEICIDSVASAQAAAAGGADRVELCAGLPEGGTTPSAGMIRAVRGAFNGRLMVIIRPRGYDFLYSEAEMEIMVHDIATARTLGADGVVIGCLTPDGQVDITRCGRLLNAAGVLDVTFHRAFDMTRDLPEALEAIISLGIRRVLTSGGQPDVPAGLTQIAALVTQAGDRLSVMPGGGVTELNAGKILEATGVHELHLSARSPVHSGMVFRNPHCHMGTFTQPGEYTWKQADAAKIRLCKAALMAHRDS
jgi:copper homeostasis protein